MHTTNVAIVVRPLIALCRSCTHAVALAFIVSATLLLGQVFGQTKPTEKGEKPEKLDKTKAEQPLELPEFVITGVESLDVPGGSKQTPQPMPKLTSEQLRRLNPLDKQSFTLLPVPPINRLLLRQQEKDGFVQGEFGMFLTPSLKAGYRAVWGNFDLNGIAACTVSGGHRRNADFTDARAEIASTYLAPEKFFFFGGSRTETYFQAHYRNFKFFGADSLAFPETAPQRSAMVLAAGVSTVGDFEHWQYDIGASAESALLNGDHENTLFNGHLAAKTALNTNFSLGGKINVQLQSALNRPFAEVYDITSRFLVGYRAPLFLLSAELGVDIAAAASVVGGGPIRPSARLQASFAASDVLTFDFTGTSGIRPNSFVRAFRLNPYTIGSVPTAYRFETAQFDMVASVRVHPSQYLGFVAGVGIENLDNAMVFDQVAQSIGTGEFLPLNVQTNTARLFAEADIHITHQDHLTARLNACFGELTRISSNTQAPIPYLSPFEGKLQYRRQWLPQLSSQLECAYFAARPIGLSGNAALPAYFDLRLSAEYQLTSNISIFARGTNLLNQEIVLWQGYQERGIFIAAGFVITF